jgi:multicomponent Na+:H+ antiporter subunit G
MGTLFVCLGAVGLLRLPDVYSRMHAITKATTLGLAGLLGASGLFFLSMGYSVFGEILTVWLVFLTNPVGGHMIGKTAYLIGIPLAEVTVLDEFGRSGEAGRLGHDTE